MSEPNVDTEGFRAIGVERLDRVLRVTLRHPASELNAVDELLHDELGALFRALRRERAARAVILTGSQRAFSAGGDFNWFPKLSNLTTLDPLRRDAKQLLTNLLDVEIPIVAALNGPAVGLGATIALLCDVIFMAEGATIADPHVRVGLVAGDGGTAIWPLVLGPARAKQYLLTGDAIPAVEAERMGLVNKVVPAEALADEALAFARRLAQGAPLALRYTKLAVNQWIKQTALVSYDFATALEIVTFQSDDHREALAAVREKRKPQFEGK
jgi:enoyl-CoA hydratase